MRALFVFLFLALLRATSKLFWTLDVQWVEGKAPASPFDGIRLVGLLNHTSLFEWLFLAAVPHRFLWEVARHGVVPAAEKTLKRPIVGRFFRAIAAQVISITRERDHTWKAVLESVDPKSIVVILPEGRMKRRNGLDANGQPMTVRGGIADLLEAIPAGGMLLAYSGGLHHVQAPGERWPRLFRKIRLTLERLDLAEYREARRQEGGGSDAGYKRAVVADLERRRDRYCPTLT